MKIIYMDCASGISGDMTIGAFLDLGVDPEYLTRELKKLGVSGYNLVIKPKAMKGIAGTDFDVILTEDEPSHDHHDPDHGHNHGHSQDQDHDHAHDHGHEHNHNHAHGHEHDHNHAHDHDHNHDHDHAHGHEHNHGVDHDPNHVHPHDHSHQHAEAHSHAHDHSHSHSESDAHAHSNWQEIRSLIKGSSLKDEVKDLALRIFRRVAEAEAKVHGVTPDEVHFHEVGAVDSIVDIVGVAICVDAIKPDRVVVSPMNTGSGTVKCRHGVLPVPAPATAEILANRGALVYSSGVRGELVTPTGAAIAAELADEFGSLPPMVLKKTAFGTGKKDFEMPNVLRLLLGEGTSASTRPSSSPAAETVAERMPLAEAPDRIMVLEANIDDMTGEIAGYVMERLLEEGALDVFYTPIFMKKNRPAIKLSVLSRNESVKALEKRILAETTTIGIRKYEAQRVVMDRTIKTVQLPYGEAGVKVCTYEGIEKAAPEYESLKVLAKKTGLPLIKIYQDVVEKLALKE